MQVRTLSIVRAVHLVVLGTTSLCGTAFAGDCDAISKAMWATLRAPTVRQYFSVTGQPERLLSITKGDTVYMTLIPGQWNKTPRAEINAEAADAEKHKKLSNCKSVGTETVAGSSTTVYAYDWAIDNSAPRAAKVWVGGDGLLRKQSTDRGGMRYDYADVPAPN